LSPEIEKAIDIAFDIFKEQILANETSTLQFNRFGGNFIKDCNMSPDALVQIAIQLAYFKMFGRLDATYESASTKQFLHGRTETVRSVSDEVLAFVKSTTQPIISTQPSVSRTTIPIQLSLLRKAADAHVRYMREAKNGKGVDRHLFGLRMIQEREGLPKPAIFTDMAYTKSSHWNISTSHCGSACLALFGFGPVVVDGFGVGYMIKSNSINFNITSKYTMSIFSSNIFAALLEQSLLHLHSIVLCDPDKLDKPSKSLNFTHPTVSAEFHYDF